MAKPTKRRRTRTKTPTHDLRWLLRLLTDVYGLRPAFITEDDHWVGPSHTLEPIIDTPGEGLRLEDGRPLLMLFDLAPILAAMRLPDVPEGFDQVYVDPAGNPWLALHGLMTLVKASDQPEMQEVWQSWLNEGGQDLIERRGDGDA